ncbi:TetR/AcrR family transcriptional regulator [Streptomyces sp. NPDC001663]|uniref:TetR/AcrR family transcriptional regulator n=1 Tax=Streptomyces sp. NPDC001663 TaxID=3364597 RepID=UPI0036AB50B6
MAVAARRRLTGKQREQQLLDVAENLFTERGYEGVSVEDIARAAGVSRPVVYQHHGSQEGIFVACVRRARQEFEDTLATAISTAGGDMDELITAGGRVFLELVANNPRRWALLFTSSSGLGGDMAEQLIKLRRHTVERIADVASPHAVGLDRPSLLAAAHVISGIGEQLGHWWLAHPDEDLDHVLRMYVAAVGGAVRGLLTVYEDLNRP